MIKDTNINRKQASRQGAAISYRSRKTRSFEMNDMTSLIMTSIASALVAGLLVLPVTMPGKARLTTQSGWVTSSGAVAMVSLPPSVSA